MKVLISDNVADICRQILEREPEIEVDTRVGLSPQELQEIIGDYSALIVRSETKVTAPIMQAASQLRVIGRAGAGVDNIDVPVATKQGIIVVNTPGGNTISTAEHTFSLLLSLSRYIPQAVQSLKENRWERKKYTGVEVAGKTLGIIGLGKVGREVARRAKAFGMQILAYDPFVSVEIADSMGAEVTDLERIYAESDYISVHTPLTEETRNLISDREFEKCKEGVRIINCARGGIIDEEALLRAIESGKVSGAALDVYETEPPTNRKLLERPEVICTPHLGASTEEAQSNVAMEVSEEVLDALHGRPVRNAVNLPPIDPVIYEKIKGYLDLAEKIGSLQAQLGGGQIVSVSVEYRGELLKYPTSPITASVMTGVLKNTSEGNVNLVNAPVIAQEQGIKVNEIRNSDPGDYYSLITVNYTTTQGSRSVSGTIFGRIDMRIVEIDQYHLDAWPEGDMLILYNEDVPGVIGRIGMTLGNNGINIGRMTWGRDKEGGKAIVTMNLDSPASDTILKQLIAQKNILWAKRVKL